MSVVGAEHRMRVGRIMHDTRLDARGKRLAVWNYIITNELQTGSQFVLAQPGGQMYAVIGATNEVLRVPSRGGSAWFGYLNATYGLLEREPWMTAVHDAFRHYIQRLGTKTEMRRLAHYDAATNIGYMSNYDGRMFKIDGDNITKILNGDDGVFFADDDPGKPCPEPDIGPHGILLEQLTSANYATEGLSGITPDQQRKALTLWLFALAFPDLLIDKPILLVEGQKGAGKSTLTSHAQLMLTGESKPMQLQRNKEDDFGVILMRSPIALFDNTDSFIDWVPDAISAYCTGAGWNKRKLFTDDENLQIMPQSFITVATRNPASFRRDDVADRCMILRLERRDTFSDRGTLRDDILNNRGAIYGEYLWHVGQITARIRTEGGLSSRNERFRMASFVALGRVIGRVLGWADEDVSDVLQALQNERDAFSAEDDPLVELLGRWITYRTKFAPTNIGREISASQLHAELDVFVQADHIQWKESPRTLAAKLRSAPVEQMFRVEIRSVNNQRMFKLWRHTDARLELVPGDEDVISIPGSGDE